MAQVAIVGGGPIGLFLACEVALHGVPVVVLERLPELEEHPKAEGITGRAIDILDRRGLMLGIDGAPAQPTPEERERIALGERRPDSLQPKAFPGARHFATMFVLRPESPDLLVPQQVLERELARRAAELGVEVRRGHTLTGFTDDGDGVRLDVEGPDGPYPLRADWLVGCDGGRSTVRKLAGIPFPGTDGVTTGYRAFADIDDPGFHLPGWFRKDNGLLVYEEGPPRFITLEFAGRPADRDAPITREEFQESLRRLSGTEVTVTEVHKINRFTDNERQAAAYRQGRVLLAGDAAHVQSQWSGPGLRLGLGDAINLGWKLAAVARGRCPEDLLDTYTAERHPVGAQTLEVQRASIALMRPGPHVDALRRLLTRLLLDEHTNRHLTALVDDLHITYDMGDPSLTGPLVGSFCPDLRLKSADGPARLAELQRGGRPLLLDLGADPALRALAEPWTDRVDVVTAQCADAPADALLIRPDGFVAWSTPAGAASLTAALERWFGPPA
ncbi:Pentachlorophenol 4-monooxygenase [Nonomuraea coxensis DSM 45129]|uniref:Pentachlorophenol 4-monooxygenase n=1 Tax=Nonomuraea coxensis DSM 45129 TaxID=1122611 RepID=A0ABX8TXF1_9ACTN|nr:FAD-dependent monooxygenase [Nonomuraea coxensis]QYC40142.1 Pentachlorophenol 4-monooxygenase [Nonomuraea coxensis DSM 45129]